MDTCPLSYLITCVYKYNFVLNTHSLKSYLWETTIGSLNISESDNYANVKL